MSFPPGVPLCTDSIVLDVDSIRRIEGAGIGVAHHAVGASMLTSPLLPEEMRLPAVPHLPWPQSLLGRQTLPSDKLTLESMPEGTFVSICCLHADDSSNELTWNYLEVAFGIV
jgi:hypothetical protein